MPPLPSEISSRVKRLAAKLREKGLCAALLRYRLHIFYFSGTFVDGHLLITAKEESYLLVYRTLERAKAEGQATEIISFRSLKKLPGFLRDLGLKRIGLEYDRLPVRQFLLYQKLLADFSLEDLSPLLWEIRAKKSPYEVDCLRRAAAMLAEALRRFLPRLRPGMTELEAAGLLEASLRRRGHPAHTRVYNWTQELAYGHLLFGASAAVPAYVTTGQGGQGVVGYPQGPGFCKLAPGEIIVIDYAGWYEGYMVDQTRLFSWGKLPKDLVEIYEKIYELMQSLEESLRPGVLAAELYEKALAEAQRLGMNKIFMAHGSEKVAFVGHGVGLEIDEWPPIAKGVAVPLGEGMIIALEPKCHLPHHGEIGLEDTFLITSEGSERLTLFPREIRLLGP